MRLSALMFAVLLAAPLPAAARSLRVSIDQAARIGLSKPAHDVVVGNPAIADVTVMDAHHLMVVGKGYGVTNLIVIDEAGRPIFNRQVVVGPPDANHVSLHRGVDTSEYACSPRCERQAGGSAAPAPSAPSP
ncbi:MAG: pilus assembly protein N-terminal domain-containing protein [Caulobacteraceae bacterium]